MKEEKKYLEGTRIEDLRGRKFGRLTVIEFDYKKHENDKRRKKNGEISSYCYYWFCRCECGNTKSVKYSHLKSGSIKSCGCYNKEVLSYRVSSVKTISFNDWCIKTNNKYLLEYYDYDKNTIHPSEIPYASEKKYWFKCINGLHDSELKSICVFTKNIRPSKLWCEKCSSFIEWGINNIDSMFVEKYISRENSKHVECLRLNSSVKIHMMCQNVRCGKTYMISCDKFYRGRRCPYCNSSCGEQEIIAYLDKLNIPYTPQKEFDGLVGIKSGLLRYDFYIPSKKLLIEYQGEQHENPIDYFGGENGFIKQQEHDRRKREYATNNNIKLLEIWYYDFNNIEKILNKELKK